MKPEKVFKRYDIRGKYPEELDEEFADLLGKSLGTFVQRNYPKKVVVCRDNKESSKTLKKSFIKGLKSTGVEIIDIGSGPTDYAAFTGREEDTVSVQVTSSHLPLEFNGFKFMYPEGNGFLNPDLDSVKDRFRNREFSQGTGKVEQYPEALEEYKENLELFARRLSENLDKKVVIDTLGGATDSLLAETLRAIGANVVDLGEEKEEKPYRDPPNPRPENLKELKAKVDETNADIGLATDMDGDRVTLYKDGFVDGNKVLAVFSQIFEGDVVASIDTSKSLEETTEEQVFYTRVGDPFVMDDAIEKDVELAGEPNGHYAFLNFVPYNSGTLSALILAGVDLERYLNKIPEHHSVRESYEVEDKKKRMEAVENRIKEEYKIVSRKDGLKVESPDVRALIRPSGSSPKIRVVTESKNRHKAEEEADNLEKIVRNP